MLSRRCVKCGSSWGSSLLKCAFCGGDSELESAPMPAENMPSYFRGAGGPDVLLKPDAATAIAVEPTPESGSPAAAPKDPTPLLEDEDQPRPIFEVTPMPPSCPRVPSPMPLLVFGLTGIVAAGLLLPAMLASGPALILCGLFAPLAPIAWITGLKYEGRCAQLKIEPALPGRAGKQLGLIGMALITVEFAFAAIIQGVQSL